MSTDRSMRMHADEREIDEALVRRLLAAQFPEWAGLALKRVPSWGTDNALFRLGDELVVRLPRIGWAVAAVAKEQEWLPWLAPQLPVEIPRPVAHGEPGEGYPWRWSVNTWVEGRNPRPGEIEALELAELVRAFRAVPVAEDAPLGRGLPLAHRDAETRAAIPQLAGAIDAARATAAWDAALATPVWSAPPVWAHGDLLSGNLLVRNGRLAAVIDFGTVGVGDPAVDCLAAWCFLDERGRATFRESLDLGDDTWARGRGWALTCGLVALPYYRETNPALAAVARILIREALPASA